MTKRIMHSLLVKILLVAVLATHLLACGGGGGGGGTVGGGAVESASVGSGNGGVTDVANDVVVSGSVGDGPVTGATIEVWNSANKMIGSVISDNSASFKSSLKVRGNEYPLLLKVRGGIDLVTGDAPDFQMVSVMKKPSDKQVNINPFTTLIVKIAASMPGGMTTGNISAAYAIVTEKLGFGLDLNVIKDPILTQVTEANVASLVKASEALGEMVRRTRDLVSRTGSPVSGDDVIAAIAADMTDGFLDGRGRSGTVPAIAAVANVVTGQVLVEALSNHLKVGGVVATGVIDQSIKTTRPRILSSQLTGSVRVTQGMLNRARVSLAAARVLDSSVEVVDLAKTVTSIAAGSLPAEVATILPADSSRSLDNAILLSSTASETDIATVNQVIVQAESGSDITDSGTTDPGTTDPGTTDPGTTDPGTTDPGTTDPGTTDPGTTDPGTTDPGTTDPVNTAPVVSGTPAGTVVAGSAYSFRPSASDADGDALRFSISNRPGWATFNTGTGRLSGTPANADARTYRNIVISVSDGQETVSLPAFSLTVEVVQETPLGSFTLNWTAPATRADGTPLSLADIDGYRIYFSNSPGNYSDVVDVPDGSAQSANVTDIPVGIYYLVMTTYDNSGLESQYSAEVTKSAQ